MFNWLQIVTISILMSYLFEGVMYVVGGSNANYIPSVKSCCF